MIFKIWVWCKKSTPGRSRYRRNCAI